MKRSKIIATGSFVPERILTNQEITQIVTTSDDWITERTGIRKRRIAGDDQATSDLAAEAARKALRRAGIKAAAVDLIIVATFTPDYPMPSTACLVQVKIGAAAAAAFDINAACSGFIYSLSIADSFIRSGSYRTVLVIGAEVISRFIDWKDRSTCVLFGDGAGAAVLGAADGDSGIHAVHIHADGTLADILTVPAGGSRIPASRESVQKCLHYVKMKGNETFKIAVRKLESIVNETIGAAGLSPDDISLIIPHQANIRIIRATAERLGVPMEKVFVNVHKYGNTSAASIPIALDEAVRTGKVKEGDYILLEAFGGGLTWGSALIRW